MKEYGWEEVPAVDGEDLKPWIEIMTRTASSDVKELICKD